MTISLMSLHYFSLFYAFKGIVCLLMVNKSDTELSRGRCVTARDCPAGLFSTQMFFMLRRQASK